MPKTIVKEKETLEDTLRRFKNEVSKAGTLAEARKREFYVKPSVERKMRIKANRQKKYNRTSSR